MKEALSVDAAIPNSHNLQSTITKRLQKYRNLKKELIRIWQLTSACVIPLVLTTAGVFTNRFHEILKLRDLLPTPHMQTAVALNTCHIVRKFVAE
jgi:hypothetical protein